jgi:hypothetical protein
MTTLNRTASLAALVLLSSLALVPSGQAAADLDLPTVGEVLPAMESPVNQLSLCDYNPDAWANACLTWQTRVQTVRAYTVDTTPDYTIVCPFGDTCVRVPVVLSVLDAYTYYVYYDYPYLSYNVNSGQVVEDVCDIIGTTCYTVVNMIGTSTTAHGLEFSSWADADGDGSTDAGLFTMQDGTLIALPLA